MLAILTAATCGDACWHAREEVCRCSCGGANHGILTRGEDQPDRTRKMQGEVFELVGVIAHDPNDCYAATQRKARQAFIAVQEHRFPGVNYNGYGPYRLGGVFPVQDTKIGPQHLKWPEVQAVPGACRLIWSRPEGSRYVKTTDDYQDYWTTREDA